MSSPTTKPPMYIYLLPYEERKRLCYILDKTNKWEELGLKHMGFPEMDMDEVREKKSPSSELLKKWGHYNHTVLDLFVLLHRMSLYQAMSTIKAFVEDKFHTLIKEDNIHVAVRRQLPDSKVPTNNFDKNTVKVVTKNVNPVHTNENNETNNLHLQELEKPSNQVPINLNGHISPRQQVQKDSTSDLTECVASSAGGTPKIPYKELEDATNNWINSNILGQGGFGTVFKGTWKFTEVAIKRLETKENTRKDFTEQVKQSVTELRCLNAYRHDNILPLYGYSIDGPHPCLVYQFMTGGSLEGRIRPKDETMKVLSWPTRLSIAIGTARGLQFLHTTLLRNKPLIHGDIKSANILLDVMDQPRIGDFGLAREGPEIDFTHMKLTRVFGTRPYLPEEFLRSKLFSTKVDTYSFGVVLFELATALPPAKYPNWILKKHVDTWPADDIMQLKDAKAPGGEATFRELVRIGKVCVQKRARDRPDMVGALIMLKDVEQSLAKTTSSSSSSSSSHSSSTISEESSVSD